MESALCLSFEKSCKWRKSVSSTPPQIQFLQTFLRGREWLTEEGSQGLFENWNLSVSSECVKKKFQPLHSIWRAGGLIRRWGFINLGNWKGMWLERGEDKLQGRGEISFLYHCKQQLSSDKYTEPDCFVLESKIKSPFFPSRNLQVTNHRVWLLVFHL